MEDNLFCPLCGKEMEIIREEKSPYPNSEWIVWQCESCGIEADELQHTFEEDEDETKD